MNTRTRILSTITALFVGALALHGLDQTREAEACGCLSPPVPNLDDEFAVNQQSEQILFEVEPGFVTAHVLIRYAGDPALFAWILPVPSIPEAGVSPTELFSLLDQSTQPQIRSVTRNVCPWPAYSCTQDPYCDGRLPPPPAPAPGGGNPPMDIEVVDRQIVGFFDLVIFSTGDVGEAVDWLNNEGFIVNDTMAPYMQPYADAGMLFVAVKLVPGADVDDIQPLKLRYQADQPMIPLRLTAVAAEPHLTVTTYIVGDDPYNIVDHEQLHLDSIDIATDGDGRVNYPMALSRHIDSVGGDGFVKELATPTDNLFLAQTYANCCASPTDDRCALGGNGVCDCAADFEAADCAALPGAMEAHTVFADLIARYPAITRQTTRMSAEEMTYDPVFEAAPGEFYLSFATATRYSLEGCEDDVLDPAGYQQILDRQMCAVAYCGPDAECAVTASGPGCICPEGQVARQYTELDGEIATTCVPSVGPVDFGAGGIPLPDACANVSCGQGTCLDVGGVATCECDAGSAAIPSQSGAPTCVAVVENTATPGAIDHSRELRDLEVCIPEPPTCAEDEWLIPALVESTGVDCGKSEPHASRLVPPTDSVCYVAPPDDEVMAGGGACGVSTMPGDGGGARGVFYLMLAMALLAFGLRRRQRTNARSERSAKSQVPVV